MSFRAVHVGVQRYSALMSAPPAPSPDRPEPVLPDSSELPELRRAIAVCAVALRELRPTITQGMTRLLSGTIEHLGDPDLLELMAASIDSNISTLMDVWEHDIAVEKLVAPNAAVEYAVRLAQRGIPLSSLTRAYQLGQTDLLGVCFRVVAEASIAEHLRYPVIAHISDVLLRYVDWVVLTLVETYERERSLWLDSPGTRNALLIHGVLQGGSTDEKAFRRSTGYRLDQTHLGCVLSWSRGESGTPLVREIGAWVGATGAPLVVTVDGTTAWIWFPVEPGSSGRGTGELDLEALAHDQDCRVALGVGLAGVDGFRRTHRQALAVHQLLTRGTSPQHVISVADDAVAVVARLAGDLPGTRLWVQETLGGLAGRDEGAARLRETLLTFLRSGGSYAHSATALTLHGNTVKYRVRKAIELRGRPLEDDRLAVELALVVCRYLGDAVLAEA